LCWWCNWAWRVYVLNKTGSSWKLLSGVCCSLADTIELNCLRTCQQPRWTMGILCFGCGCCHGWTLFIHSTWKK
jgi:hypothetical protein